MGNEKEIKYELGIHKILVENLVNAIIKEFTKLLLREREDFENNRNLKQFLERILYNTLYFDKIDLNVYFKNEKIKDIKEFSNKLCLDLGKIF